jgi:hypothetical protein
VKGGKLREQVLHTVKSWQLMNFENSYKHIHTPHCYYKWRLIWKGRETEFFFLNNTSVTISTTATIIIIILTLNKTQTSQ